MTLTLVLGGARSGKSAYARRAAEAQARERGGRLTMIATAEAMDDEMALRIDLHRRERGADWITREEPLDLASAIAQLEPHDVAVVDCLTLWLNNLMYYEKPLDAAFDDLVRAVQTQAAGPSGCALFLVSNEVGQGVAPDNPLARRFRDEAGRLHQRLANVADRVVFITAGLAQTLNGVIQDRTAQGGV
jgi:adenosylcobinamide kinase/adenosylcobinamide-phosphate guanylyltransferase